MAQQAPTRLALVVHPTRRVAGALETLEQWAEDHGLVIVQIPALGGWDRDVAEQGELEPGDLVIALGGDGTVLSALRAAAPFDAPVMGVPAGASAHSLRWTPIGSSRRWTAWVAATGRPAAFPPSRSIPRMRVTSGR